ncbi:oxidoreductase (pseudo-gene by frame shift) [Komagataeibacter medellinensis NBRC 3288]|uniref:Oxidoreductase (Pseudo-gene by frame shift) n=1 Tax=Komagataeibacter medellinensis (strain NBRC 3288 / BCRC 11682 / LMG 1693 / Kondo 51) TaxID=634177 RepID=G2I735_KOMMN|nr:oxidoreductase (pseudo-gene by frame shift) [Komagataeibacter medellinensis NBRC 3288]
MPDDSMPPSSRRTVPADVAAGLVGAAAAGRVQAADMAPEGVYPRPPFLQQSQPWPGLAGKMMPRPDHGETSYRGSGRQRHQPTGLDITDEPSDETFRTNIYALFYLSKAAIPFMPRGGAIIATASVNAFSPSEILLDYSATKRGDCCLRQVAVQADGPSWYPRERRGLRPVLDGIAGQWWSDGGEYPYFGMSPPWAARASRWNWRRSMFCWLRRKPATLSDWSTRSLAGRVWTDTAYPLRHQRCGGTWHGCV